MKIGCLNVNGINVGKLEDLMTECEEWKLDVLCMTETHLREVMDVGNENHTYSVLGKGRSKQNKKGGGIAVLVRKDSNIGCEELNIGECEMSEDLMAIKLEYNGEKERESLYVCVCYMTVEGQEGKVENKKKYEILKQFVREHKNERVLVVGDMNGHIGLLGERMNFNGALLRETCEGESLEILNETIAEGKVTWCKREQQSVVDYVLVNETEREKVVSVWIDEGREFSVNTDHNLVLVRHECRMERKEKVKQKQAKWKLRTGNWSAYKNMLNDVSLECTDDINDLNNELVRKLREVAEQSVGRVKKKRKRKKAMCTWWNEDIRQARNERKLKNRECRRLRAAMEQGHNVREDYQRAWDEYTLKQKCVKILIRKARVKDENMKLEELRRKGEAGGREWYSFLQGKNRNDVVVDEITVRNQRVQGKKEIASAVKEFWEEVGGVSEPVVSRDIHLSINEKDMSELDQDIMRAEVEVVVKRLKNGKAAGLDDIPYEMYKWGGSRMIDLMVTLFNSIWNGENVPKCWNESRVILLHKGGQKNKKDLRNYRPIALMDTIGKIFCMLLNERMSKCVETNGLLSEEQNGFRSDRRGEDNLFIVRELMERCKRENKRSYFAFLDIEKAYDRVNREILCKVLNKCGVSGKVVRIISSMYTDTRAKYMIGDIETDWVYSKRGVRQGCILSPLLFSLYTEELILKVKRLGLGMEVGNERLSILLYADDVIIMSECAIELQAMLNAVSEYSNDFCVSFSEAKSKVIVINGMEEDVDREWQIGGISVKRTKEYKYLGVTLTESGSEKIMDDKVCKANQWYGRLASVARIRANKYEVLRELWKTVAVPNLLYGMNVLYWNECHMQKLEVVQNKVGRVALGANSFAAVEAIRGDMGWSSFSERCMKGSIMYKKRMDENRWVKKVCEKVGLKSRWLGMCKRVVKKCGLKVNTERSADRQV